MIGLRDALPQLRREWEARDVVTIPEGPVVNEGERDERPTDQTHMATPDQRITVEDLPDPRLPEK